MSVYQEFDAELEADVQMADDFVVRIRSDLHPKMRKMTQFLSKKHRAYAGQSDLPLEVQDDVDIRKAACAIAGWSGSGATDKDGKPLEYSEATALALVTAMPQFRRRVLIHAFTEANFRKADLAELGKDSSTSSEPTSSGPTVES